MHSFADHLHLTLNNKQLASHKASHWTEESEMWQYVTEAWKKKPVAGGLCVLTVWEDQQSLWPGKGQILAAGACSQSSSVLKTGQEADRTGKARSYLWKVPYSPKTVPSAGDQVLITGTFRDSSHSNRSIDSCVVLQFYTRRSCNTRAHPCTPHCQEKSKWQQGGARVSAAIPPADPILAHFHLSLRSFHL